LIALVAAVMVGGGAYLAWLHETTDVPIGFARSNGRLEAEHSILRPSTPVD
jgi:hypothetical protein